MYCSLPTPSKEILAYNHTDNDIKTQWSFLYFHFCLALDIFSKLNFLKKKKSFKCYVGITTGKGKGHIS